MKILMNKISIARTVNKTVFILFLLSCFLTGCSKKKGCMYQGAANYDPEAEEEDGSCKIYGCMDPNGLNYDQYANIDDGSCQVAGSGGNTTIVAFPQHHGAPIFSHTNYRDTAYVKFNAQEFPGTNPSLYDLTFIGEDGEDHVHLEELKAGKYYIYMVGLDTTIMERVTGGIPYVLTQTSGEVDLIVPVTE